MGCKKAVIIIDYFISRAISTDAYPVCPKSSKERDCYEKSTSPQLAILKQVNNGIAVRMAVMAMAGQRQAGDFKAYN